MLPIYFTFPMALVPIESPPLTEAPDNFMAVINSGLKRGTGVARTNIFQDTAHTANFIHFSMFQSYPG